MLEIEAQNQQFPAIAEAAEETANEEKMSVLIETIEEAIGIIRQNRDEEYTVMKERAAITNSPIINNKYTNYFPAYEKVDSRGSSSFSSSSDQYRISKFKLIVLMSLMFMSVVGIVFGFEMLTTFN
jgi:hypothetical protein